MAQKPRPQPLFAGAVSFDGLPKSQLSFDGLSKSQLPFDGLSDTRSLRARRAPSGSN
jgi:hypothetical protein